MLMVAGETLSEYLTDMNRNDLVVAVDLRSRTPPLASLWKRRRPATIASF
ncbi:hypothetical protein [Lichenifustis flavocetrariae]|uniref:Uncharacterized protein n=1 Tax=Lichenifustis flavocetrariae TaxID=2949735 RepID=A0AA42CJS7_9HYPH|nr:hypothetical protein [Lichenifustis flavocetrariae]MCW6508416.1 hypothetical protein [Lichenifustis flavocetrariae]